MRLLNYVPRNEALVTIDLYDTYCGVTVISALSKYETLQDIVCQYCFVPSKQDIWRPRG